MGNGDQAEGPGAFYPGGCLIGISTHIGDETVMATTTAQIQQLYVAYLGRAADKAGLDYWLNELNADNATLTLENLRANFVNEQAEYQDAYAGLSRQDTVIKIYNNLFGRAPDAAGLEYWTTGGGASVNADQLLTAFVNGAGADDSKVITNKVLVSEVYTSTAGDKYLAADAKAIIADVVADGASVGAALDMLTDGSLSGIAVPAAVANLKASVAADTAVTTFETTKAVDLLALENKLVDLSKADANIANQDTTLKAGAKFGDVNTELGLDLAAARVGLGDTKTLTAAAEVTAEDLVDARTALTAADKASVAHVTAYTAALAAVKANVAITTADETQAVSTLSAFATNPANTAAWTKALADAGITASAAPADAAATAQTVYDALTSTTASAAVIANTKASFASVTNFNSVTAISDKDLANQKAVAAQAEAAKPLNDLKDATGAASTAGSDWIKALADNTDAQSKVASSKALDALDSSYKTITDGYKAATDANKAAVDKLVADDVLVETAGVLSVVADDSKAEVFYFAQNKVTGADGSLTLTAGGDSLYIGEGYTLNKSATLGANGIAQADNNAKEVFFFKAADNSVKAVIETSVIGSTTVGDNVLGNHVDGVSVITLTGVTDISQVTFANGVISHVA